MIARLSLVLVLTLTFSVVEADKAQAQCGLQGGAGLYGYGFGGYGFDVGRLYGVLAQNVPYYAAFPPVYYSAPVPRTYGYSPFAYPPGTPTPEIELPTVAAKEIVNPFVPTSGETKAQDQNNITQRATAPTPLAITNPYVSSPKLEVEGPVLTAAAVNR
ncbi:MAG: hypothetical protein AAGD11_15820 [Planctomycetota bacterium]